MSLLSIYWILRAVDHIFLLLVILFLPWYLYLYTRNTNRLQDESDSENQTVDTETDSNNVNSSRDEGSDVINKNDSSSKKDKQWHQDILLMIQQLKDEKWETDREIATLKRGLKYIDQRVVKLEVASNPRKQIDCPVPVKIPEKGIASQQDERWHQERELMIQQFKDERDSEIAKLKQLIESKKTESQCESTDKMEKLQDLIKDMDRRIIKLETSGSSGKHTKDSTGIKIQESTNLGNSKYLDEDENIEALDACSHGNGQQQIHPVISTVTDVGSTAEAKIGCNTNEEQDTISKTRTSFLTLHNACLKGDFNNLKDLIESGHDINERFEGGMTPILYCSQSHIEPVSKIKMLLDKGCNIDDRDTVNNNILHLACEYGRLETVDYLLHRGLVVHSRGFDDNTPILYCSLSYIEPVSKIKMILDKGGNIDDIDTDNNNMLHLACKYGCLETVDYLLQLGLDVESINRFRETPVDCCRYPFVSKSDEKIKLLEEKLKLRVV